eukprot:CAMPEP_0176435256 /NCGR_PEP_ID=MMETSP0127-20121128/17200_1 /TAXON_ID=938130 /ORGANISM="Platyophrya macrostoma, Strain WH" /LENGTH=200 /DNA_ID=CAMNT_0017818221 /DNA_START=102 /DNA_END=704 /DNA_ORIENTATION=+
MSKSRSEKAKAQSTKRDPIDVIFGHFAKRGAEGYYGEDVTQQEHAIQTAMQGEEEGADEALIIAGLLHDVGHLLHNLGEDIAEQGIDTQHEIMGASYLKQWFGPAVTEPIRLHVPAKRYMCLDKDYMDNLSAASKLSLKLQGGVFTKEEAEAFMKNPYAKDAVRLRKWDDLAKRTDIKMPPLEHYRDMMKRVLAKHPSNL